MADPQVIFKNIDWYARGIVISIPKVTEQRTFQGDKLITNEFDIILDNRDNMFSINNPNSIFYGTSWLYETITIYGSSGELIWGGVIIKIIREHKNGTVTITSKNSLFSYRHEIIEYETTPGNWETIADAFKNICDNAGFTNYDITSVNQSINDLTSASCYVRVNINKSDNMTLQNVIEKLALYANADAYSHLNNIYFIHWKPTTGQGGVSLTIDDIKSLPESVREDEANIINNFSISYFEDQGIPATDADNNNIGSFSRAKYGSHDLPDMQSGEGDNQIIFKDLTSALYIGESYIKKTNKNYDSNLVRPLTQFYFNIFADNKTWLTLQSTFNLTLADEGWDETVFEPFEYTIDEDTDDIRLFVLERP